MGRDADARIAEAFLRHTRDAIAQEHRRIVHSLSQLNQEDIWRRPEPHVNCVGTIMLHLCGNMRQWFLHGIGGEEDVRERPAEFAEGRPVPREELLEAFGSLVGRIDELLAHTREETLLQRRHIQGFDTNGLSAIYSATNHLEGHSLQIAYITHMLVGGDYEPFWKPASEAQGAMPAGRSS